MVLQFRWLHGQCVENAHPESGAGPLFICSQSGVWSLCIGTDVCVVQDFSQALTAPVWVRCQFVYLSAFLSLCIFFFFFLSSHPLQPVMLGHMEEVAPASPVLPTVTAHSLGCLCVPVSRDTTELLGNLQKWPVLVSHTHTCTHARKSGQSQSLIALGPEGIAHTCRTLVQWDKNEQYIAL